MKKKSKKLLAQLAAGKIIELAKRVISKLDGRLHISAPSMALKRGLLIAPLLEWDIENPVVYITDEFREFDEDKLKTYQDELRAREIIDEDVRFRVYENYPFKARVDYSGNVINLDIWTQTHGVKKVHDEFIDYNDLWSIVEELEQQLKRHGR